MKRAAILFVAAIPAAACGGVEDRAEPQAAPPSRGQIVVIDENYEGAATWWTLRVVSAAGGLCRTVFRYRAQSVDAPSVSPNGLLFAYGDGRSLFVRPVAGGRATVIPSTAREVTWASDSRRLVFVEGDSIVIVGASGGPTTRVRIPVPEGGATLSSPELSPDGGFLAYVKDWTHGPDGTLENSLDVIRVDGVGGPRELYRGANAYSVKPSATWSPDGTKLVFADEANLAAMAIFVVNADGTGFHRLTNPRGGYGDAEPRWSPDGRRIAFTSSRHLPVQTDEGRVFADAYVMNADGSRQRRLTVTRPIPPGVASRGTVAGPWSPDGAMLALIHHRDVDVVRLDGTGRHKLCRASPRDISQSLYPAAWRR